MRALLVGLVAAAAALVPAAALDGAAAVDQSQGYPGFCTSTTGVTVVIDFQELGGETLVRCNPTAKRGTGLDALKGAGFQIAGVQRWGEAFICRIENRPSAVETLKIPGNDSYKERCIDTPPATAYWSYWHAGNNCSWEYSQWGVKNRDFVTGGFEGWSFSLNRTANSNPVPRIAPSRPGTDGGPCTAVNEPEPTTNNPNEEQPEPKPTVRPSPRPSVASDPGTPPRSPSVSVPPSTSASSVTPSATPTASATATLTGTPVAGQDPEVNVPFSGGEDAPDVNDVIAEQSGASRAAPWVAGGAIAVLLVASGVTAQRRRRRRVS